MSRRGWVAVFSINPRQELWPQFQFGRTSHRNRVQIRGEFGMLDHIARRLLRVRPEGGRFFVRGDGVYLKDEEGTPVQFIRFRRW